MAENLFVLKLNKGADIVDGLKKFAQEKNIDYGVLVGARGKIKEFEVIATLPKAGIDVGKYGGEVELQEMSGNVRKARDNSLNVIISILFRSGVTVKAGQLVKGKAASGGLEITIRNVDMKKMIIA